MGRHRQNMFERTLNENKPLYCWKVTDEGEIIKSVITMYSDRQVSSYKNLREYRYYDDKRQIITTNTDKLGRFVNNKVYLFEDDDSKAFQIIKDGISEKIIRYQSAVEKQAEFLMKVTGGIQRYEENH